jgi:hypothetical protein
VYRVAGTGGLLNQSEPITPPRSPPIQDRFYVSAYGDEKFEGVGLCDLNTGKSGDLVI